MRAAISTTLFLMGAACVPAGQPSGWPETESVVRLFIYAPAAGGLRSEVATARGPFALRSSESTYLLSLRASDLAALHPHAASARAHEIQVQTQVTLCETGYDRATGRVYGPVPNSALWHQLDPESGTFTALNETPEVARGLRLSIPFETERLDAPGRLSSYGAEARVTADGWLVGGRPTPVNTDGADNRHHLIMDVHALDEDHVLIVHADRAFVFERGAPPVTSEQDLVLLRSEELAPVGDRDRWAFATAVVLPERAPSGAFELLIAISTGDDTERMSRISWVEVEVEPPAFRVVASTTVAGGMASHPARLDALGRGVFTGERPRDWQPVHERRVVHLAGPEPPLLSILPERTEVFGSIGVTSLPEAPHVVHFESGRVWITDLGESRPRPRKETQVPRLTGQGIASVAAHVDDEDEVWIAVGGETGAYFVFDPTRDTWAEPRFVAAPETLRAPGCLAGSSEGECGLFTPGRELRDLNFHVDASGRLWTFTIPRDCTQILSLDPMGAVTGIPFVSQGQRSRLIQRMRPGFQANRRLLGTAAGELFELELD